MKRTNRLSLRLNVALLALSLAGCASPTQRMLDESAVKQERTMQESIALLEAHRQTSRLQDLAFPLLHAASTRCEGKRKPKIGVQLHSAKDYSEEKRDAAEKAFGALDGIRIKHTVRGSPAAGMLLNGDRILQIGGQPVAGSSRDATRQLSAAISTSAPIHLRIKRHDEDIDVELSAVPVCDYPVVLSSRDSINAFADGNTIVINAGLARFAQADAELALIIAHELAHNVIDHRSDKIRGGLIGGLFDIAISAAGNVISPGIGVGLGANLFSQHYEVEADKLAIRLMHQLDYPIESLPEFWRKMASVHPSSIRHGQQASHPTTVERYLIMKQEVERLRQTQEKQTKK